MSSGRAEGALSLGRAWAEMLAQWAIPDELVAAAPESPYFFDPDVFIAAADESLARDRDSPSDVAARGAMPPAASVLDVGAGAGAASLRLDAGRVIAVDTNPILLDAFAARAERRGTAVTRVEGAWPDAAADTPTADVVVCHHVVYNVPHLDRFLSALAEHAASRVVIELTAEHPMAWMRPYWMAMYGLDQPSGPTADDAIALATALGFDVHQQRWQRRYQMIGETGDHRVARIARRLCLPPERRQELRDVVAATPPAAARDMVTMWWSRET